MNRLKQKKIWIIVVGIVVLIVVLIGVVRLIRGPSLGADFRHIGTVNSSCDWLGALVSIGLCKPQEEYFFETDMSIAELKERINGFESSKYYSASDQAYSGTELTFQFSGQEFRIFCYEFPEEVAEKHNIHPPQKKYLVGIRDFYLDEARRALE